jgi:hypothetical protein
MERTISVRIACSYKFGLEYFNGAFITLANELFGDQRYKKIGILTGMNAAMQCVSYLEAFSPPPPYRPLPFFLPLLLPGFNIRQANAISSAQVGAILIAPLIKKFPTRSVLSCAVFCFGLMSAILLIVDAATGGKPKYMTADNQSQYGSERAQATDAAST